MRIAIVDDITEERKKLRDRLEHSLSNHSVYADIFEFENGECFLAAFEKKRFTVVFLDIYMEGMTGIEVSERLRSVDTGCLLIFTTTSMDHALDGFRVRAMHYLVKPYDETAINSLVDEILHRIPKPDKYMNIKVGSSDVLLHFRDIVYAEHFSHIINIHTTSRKVLAIRQSFSEFTAPLQGDDRFFLCGRGIIVNLEHAVDFDGSSFVMDDENGVFVSRNLIKTARQTFMDFLFKRGPQ